MCFQLFLQHQCLSHLSAYGHMSGLHNWPNIVFAILNFFIFGISGTIKAFGGVLG
jgi:hypothetical protein